MKDIVLNISKAGVYDEVAKTTSYAGAKMPDDEGAYERIFTTDEDRLMLERFWTEASNGATERMKRYIVEVTFPAVTQSVDLGKDYRVRLRMSNSFDETLKGSIETLLHSYFVNYIVAKWFKFTNKEESESYGNDAAGAMEDALRILFFNRRPKRELAFRR